MPDERADLPSALLRVKRIIIGPELRRRINLPRNILQQLLIHIFREGFGDINIPREVTLSGCGFLINWQEGHFLQYRFGVIPIMGIRYHDQFFIDYALFKNISAIANQISGFRPLFTAFYVGFCTGKKAKLAVKFTNHGNGLSS